MPDRWYSVHPLVALMAVSLIVGSLWGAPASEAALVRSTVPAEPAELTAQAWQAEPDEEERLAQGPHPRKPKSSEARGSLQAPGDSRTALQTRTERQSYQAASRGLPTGRMLTASWYGAEFEGRETANGETFHKESLTAAHPSLPFGTMLRLTNLKNGRSVDVRINDRGPWIAGRDLDLSEAAFRALAPLGAGVIAVQMEALPR